MLTLNFLKLQLILVPGLCSICSAYPHTHTHLHVRTHELTYPLTRTHTYSRHAHTHTRTHAHTHTRAHKHSRVLNHLVKYSCLFASWTNMRTKFTNSQQNAQDNANANKVYTVSLFLIACPHSLSHSVPRHLDHLGRPLKPRPRTGGPSQIRMCQ